MSTHDKKDATPQALQPVLFHLLRRWLLLPLALLVSMTTLSVAIVGSRRHFAGQVKEVEALARQAQDTVLQADRALLVLVELASRHDPGALQAAMDGIWRNVLGFDVLYRLSPEGEIDLLVPEYAHPEAFYQTDRLSPDKECWQSPEDNGPLLSTPYRSYYSQYPAIQVARPVGRTGSLIVIELSLQGLQEMISNQQGLVEGWVYVADRSGTLLAERPSRALTSLADVSDRDSYGRALARQGAFVCACDGRLVVASSAMVPTANWIVVRETPAAIFVGPYLITILVAGLLMALLWLLLEGHIRRRLGRGVIRPLTHLNRRVAAVAAGDYAQGEAKNAWPRTFAELEELSGNLRRMSQQVQGRQNALRKSQERLRQIIQNMPVMMDAFNEDGELIAWNRECERVTGYSHAEVTENPRAFELFYPDEAYRNEMLSRWRQRGNDYRHWEWNLTCKDGSIKTISWSNISDRFPIPGWASWGVGVDVTERVRAEQALRESQQRYRTLYEAMNEGVALHELIYDEQGEPVDYRFLDVNPAFETIIGRDRAAVVGNRASELFSTVSPPYLDTFARVVATGEPIVFEEYFAFLDMTLFFSVFSPAEHQFGSVFFDVSERRAAEEAVNKLANRLQVLHEIDQAILAARSLADIAQGALDNIRQLVPCERASVTIFDLQADQSLVLATATERPQYLAADSRIGLPAAADLITLAHGEAIVCGDLSGGETRSAEQAMLLANGIASYINLPLVARGVLIGSLNLGAENIDAFEPDAVQVARQVADQLAIALHNAHLHEQVQQQARELDRRVSERTAQLEAVNRELDAFAYSVSHDLRAPLRAISGFGQIIARRYAADLDPRAQRYLGNIIIASEQMNQLIEDLLRYSRLGRKAFRSHSVDLYALLNELRETLSGRLLENQGQIKLAPAADWPPVIESDPTLLNQILSNLIDNALTYRRPDVPPLVTITCRTDPAAGELVIAVADNGIGIAPAYHQKIFTIFQRLHSTDDYPGTGIGLALVHKAVTLLNGRIWLQSKPDQGSTFFVALPLPAGGKAGNDDTL